MPFQGTAAGRGSAACVEFLEETFKAAAEAAAEGDETGVGENDDEEAKDNEAAATEDNVDTTETDDDSLDTSGRRKTRSKRGRGRDGGNRATEPRDEHSSGRRGSATQRIATTGFGSVLRGERETVELALQALSKVRCRRVFCCLSGKTLSFARVQLYGECVPNFEA